MEMITTVSVWTSHAVNWHFLKFLRKSLWTITCAKKFVKLQFWWHTCFILTSRILDSNSCYLERHTLLFKINIFECSWNPNSGLHTKFQLSSLKNKKVGKTLHCPLQNVHCALSAHLFVHKIMYKNVYETYIQACIPNFRSLAWKTKKLGKMCTVHPWSALCTALCTANDSKYLKYC